jgi:hypothetical protein
MQEIRRRRRVVGAVGRRPVLLEPGRSPPAPPCWNAIVHASIHQHGAGQNGQGQHLRGRRVLERFEGVLNRGIPKSAVS